ncbi:MAG: hypothetical protein PHP54_00535 [Clostridia bacterium]|nr:hypothetical protein [Clostridia bacterium]
MEKKKPMMIFIVAVLSIALIALISIYFLNNTGKINQGNFRINDAVLESYITIEEKQEDTVTELSHIVMNLSQENKLSFLITKNVAISDIYIDKLSVNKPEKLGKLYINQNNKEESIDCFDKEGKYNITAQEKDNQYLVELKIVNQNCMQDVNVPNETKVLKYDGTLLELLNRKISDFTFHLSFNLNIVEENGKLNICKVALDMPSEELITNGVSIIRLDTAKLVFSVK